MEVRVVERMKVYVFPLVSEAYSPRVLSVLAPMTPWGKGIGGDWPGLTER